MAFIFTQIALPSKSSRQLSRTKGSGPRQPNIRTMEHRRQGRVTVGSNEKMRHSPIASSHANGPVAEQTFCQRCAAEMEERKPPGDERVRNVCTNCDMVAYENPKVVVGCVPLSRDRKRVLLARRAIPPVGKWTFPAGFLEMDETAERGAAREAWEETRAELDMQPTTLLAVYNILPAKQVQLLYRGTVVNEDAVAPGSESQEVRMFNWAEIPWDDLAFPTVKWALEYSYEHRDRDIQQPQLKYR